MSSLSLLPTSVNPTVSHDPLREVLMSLPMHALQSVLIALLATALPLILLSIDVVAGSYKPTRLERIKEATIFSKRAWTLSLMYVGFSTFLLAFATSILSVAAQMDPVQSFVTIVIYLIGGGVAIGAIFWVVEQLRGRLSKSRLESRERDTVEMM